MDDTLNLNSLSADSQEAFTQYVSQLLSQYEESYHEDRGRYTNPDGYYEGSYEPERSYVVRILAFLDEYGLETEIIDISDLEDDEEFNKNFKKFKSRVDYTTMRYRLRKNRIATGSIATVIEIGRNYKSEIGILLNKIRKIVNQEIKEGNKKDKIFAKISVLQSEVDRDQTTFDAFCGGIFDLSKVLGEAVGNIKPAVDQLEQIKKLFWENSEKVEQLPKPDRLKMISENKYGEGDADGVDGQSSNDIDDDELPF